MFNQQNLVKLLIGLAQLMALMPFVFNFETKIFQKSILLHTYSIILSVSYSVIYFLFALNYLMLNEIELDDDFVTMICIFSSGVLVFLHIIYLAHLSMFKTEKIIKQFNETILFFQYFTCEKFKDTIFFVLILAILDFIILPALIITVIFNGVIKKSSEFITTVLILNYIETWAMSSLLPLYVLLQFFIVILKNLNEQIDNIICDINFQILDKIVICSKIEIIFTRYFKLIRLIHSINKFYQLNILLSLVIIIFVFIRKTYYLTYKYLWKFEDTSEFYVFAIQKVIEYCLNVVMTTKFVILFLHGYQILNDENIRTKLLLRHIHVQLVDKQIIDAVR